MAQRQTGTPTVTIKPPHFGVVAFTARGIAPLVIHRFSAKTGTALPDTGRQGGVWQGVVWNARAGEAGSGLARPGTVGHGLARLGKADMARQ